MQPVQSTVLAPSTPRSSVDESNYRQRLVALALERQGQIQRLALMVRPSIGDVLRNFKLAPVPVILNSWTSQKGNVFLQGNKAVFVRVNSFEVSLVLFWQLGLGQSPVLVLVPLAKFLLVTRLLRDHVAKHQDTPRQCGKPGEVHAENLPHLAKRYKSGKTPVLLLRRRLVWMPPCRHSATRPLRLALRS